jgi:hypothetical protein
MTLDTVLGMSVFSNLNPIVSWTATLLIACLFASAAWHKFSGLAEFRGALSAYRLLPEWAVGSSAVLLVVLEASIALALLFRLEGASLAAFLLLGTYSAAMLLNLLRGRRWIDCGCGGPGQPISYALLMRNAVLMGLCLLASPAPAPAPAAVGTLGAFTVVAAALTGLLLYAAINHVLMLRAMLDEPEL